MDLRLPIGDRQLGIEAAGVHECLGGFSVLGASRESKDESSFVETTPKQGGVICDP